MYSNYWSSDNYFYSGTNLTSQKVSDLFDKITAQERNLFYKEWIKVIREKEFLVLDITSISSYSKKLDESEFGHNRDKEKLPQINLCLLFGEESYLPMYQNIFNGSLNDVKTLSETIMEFFGIIGDYNFTLVMDKGFYSDNNINFMLSKKEIEFLISVPFTCQYATDLVNIENNINNFDNYIHTSKEDDICRGKTRFILWNNGFIKFLSDDEVDIYNEDNILKAYIYYNPISALKAEQKFFKILNEAKEKLLKKSKDKKYIEYSKYFNIIIDSKTKKVVSITNKIAVIEEHLKTNGYFILLSNSLIKNSNNDESNNQYKIYRNQQDAYNIYRRKDVVEKSFNNYKNHLGLDRFHVHGSKRMINKSFILFLAQILYTLIYKKMIDNKLFESLTFEEMLLEMKKIKKITIDNVDYIKPLTKRQKTILESFNVPIPITL
jgi:transposase